MSRDPLLASGENIRRFRKELRAATDADLIALAAKELGLAPGIAAQQILAERRNELEAWRFRITVVVGAVGVALAAVAAVTGCIAVVPLVQQWQGKQSASDAIPSPQSAASAPPAPQTGKPSQTQ